MEAEMSEALCVNCKKPRNRHHRDGWCYWLSETDHLPIQYSTRERTVLVLVDETGQPLVAPPEAGLD
jgi:hypothetical protein